jgi:hypothetical protein
MKKYDLLYCMGDSFVVGQGQDDDINREVTVENRFSNLIATHYGLECVNNAVAGCSNEHIAKTVYSDILKFKDEGINPLVVVTYTEPSRTEIYSNKLKSTTTISESTVVYFKDYMIDNYNAPYALNRSIYNALSVKTLLNYCNFDFVDAWTFEYHENYVSRRIKVPYMSNVQEIDTPISTIAGDDRFKVGEAYLHPTPAGHRKIANTIIEKINTLYGSR